MLKTAKQSIERFKGKLKWIFRRARGRSIDATIKDLHPVLTGWINYFKLSSVTGILKELDGWIRRRFRCILWLQWKRPHRRAVNLMKLGLSEENAWKTATNGRGSWWNSGSQWLNMALPKKYFDDLGLISLFSKWYACHSSS